MPHCASLLLAGFLVLFASNSGPAFAEPPALPVYDGGGFAAIKGPADPEEYSWVVNLLDAQELRQIDERTAVVYDADGEHIAFAISADAAHDAEGSAVPTSLAVSGSDVITRVIHHRAGNPAAGGRPFAYPITDGVGWEGGFRTQYVDIPDELRPASDPSPTCIVPGLRGRSLTVDRRRLTQAGCALGRVRGQRSRSARVVKQDLPAGTALPAGARIGVKLAA